MEVNLGKRITNGVRIIKYHSGVIFPGTLWRCWCSMQCDREETEGGKGPPTQDRTNQEDGTQKNYLKKDFTLNHD